MAERKEGETVTGAAQASTGEQAPARQITDEEFKPFRERLGKENERLSEKYDGLISSLQAAAADPFPETLAKIEEKLRVRYDELRLRVSESRRAGKDMLIPSLVLREFPAKLVLAHATREPKDYEIARLTLESAQFEIDEAVNATVIDVKKEVMKMAGIVEVDRDAMKGQRTLKKEAPPGVSQR